MSPPGFLWSITAGTTCRDHNDWYLKTVRDVSRSILLSQNLQICNLIHLEKCILQSVQTLQSASQQKFIEAFVFKLTELRRNSQNPTKTCKNLQKKFQIISHCVCCNYILHHTPYSVLHPVQMHRDRTLYFVRSATRHPESGTPWDGCGGCSRTYALESLG